MMEEREFTPVGKRFAFFLSRESLNSTRACLIYVLISTWKVLHRYQDHIYDQCHVEEPHQSYAWNQKPWPQPNAKNLLPGIQKGFGQGNTFNFILKNETNLLAGVTLTPDLQRRSLCCVIVVTSSAGVWSDFYRRFRLEVQHNTQRMLFILKTKHRVLCLCWWRTSNRRKGLLSCLFFPYTVCRASCSTFRLITLQVWIGITAQSEAV